MSVQDDKAAGQEEDQRTDEAQATDEDQPRTEKPEPGEEQKEKAAEMMVAYEDRPTLVLPGSGGTVSGTAVNDWLDEEGNPKYNNEVPDHIADQAKEDQADSDDDDKKNTEEQIEWDKAMNAKFKKAAEEAYGTPDAQAKDNAESEDSKNPQDSENDEDTADAK